jgi:hypothetical protein
LDPEPLDVQGRSHQLGIRPENVINLQTVSVSDIFEFWRFIFSILGIYSEQNNSKAQRKRIEHKSSSTTEKAVRERKSPFPSRLGRKLWSFAFDPLMWSEPA